MEWICRLGFIFFLATSVEGGEIVRVTRLRGKVELTRGKASRLLTGEEHLENGDLLSVHRDGGARILAPGFLVDLAQGTHLRLGIRKVLLSDDVEDENVPYRLDVVPHLLYGHLRLKSAERRFSVRLPIGKAVLERGEAFVHFTRTERELSRLSAGKVIEVIESRHTNALARSPDSHTRFSVLRGKAKLELPGKRKSKVKDMEIGPGRVVRMSGAVTGFEPDLAGLAEIELAERSFQFPTD